MKFDRGGSTEECSNQAGASGEAAKMDPDINRNRRLDTAVRKKPFKVLLDSGQGRVGQGKRVKKRQTSVRFDTRYQVPDTRYQYRWTGVWPMAIVATEGERSKSIQYLIIIIIVLLLIVLLQ